MCGIEGSAQSGVAGPAAHDPAGAEAGLLAPRKALFIILTVLSGYTLLTVINVLTEARADSLTGAELAGFVVATAIVFALQVAQSTGEPWQWPKRVQALTLTSHAMVTGLPFLWLGWPWTAMAGFLAGSLLLVITRPLRWTLFGGVGAAVLLIMAAQHETPLTLVYLTFTTFLTGLVVYGISSLSALAAEIHGNRAHLAQIATTRERLRVARDLHDLLGFNVSVITLKSELIYKLLPQFTERARAEVADVLLVARRALADVRVVAGGYRNVSLASEVAAAESILRSADIETEVNLSVPALPPKVDTVMAIVLREAITNVLRHSKAERCTIEAVRDADTVRLRVDNDGSDTDLDRSTAGDGSGLRNLATRLTTVGGHLSIHAEDGEFHLYAEAPAGHETEGRGGREHSPRPLENLPHSGSHHSTTQEPSSRGDLIAAAGLSGESRLPQKARLIILVVLSGYFVVGVINALTVGANNGELAGFLVCCGVVFALQLGHSFLEPLSWPWQIRALTLSAQAIATYLPLWWIGTPWGSMAGFLAGSVLLVMTGRPRWVLFALASIGAVLLATVGQDLAPAWVGYLLISSPLTGLIVYGMSSLSWLVAETFAARAAMVDAVVTKQRLRVAQDLHDLLGQHLSAMTVKAELLQRLLPNSPDPARDEVAAILAIARRSATEVRSVASGYRHMSLAAEFETAEAMLSPAGVQVRIRSREELPREIDTLLAVVLREAITNVLRHSNASQCVIDVHEDGGTSYLSVVNDGLESQSHRGGEYIRTEQGLGSLAERLEAAGGRLAATIEDQRFRLVASIPTAVS